MMLRGLLRIIIKLAQWITPINDRDAPTHTRDRTHSHRGVSLIAVGDSSHDTVVNAIAQGYLSC